MSAKTTFDFDSVQELIGKAKNDAELYSAIVNAPFIQKLAMAQIFLGIIVLLLVNDKTKTIDRIALSGTEMAKNTLKVSVVPFEDIRIPLGAPGNIIAQAIKTQEPQETSDWKDLFYPAMSEEASRINQASAGIVQSQVYPLAARSGGALIYSYYHYRQSVGEAEHIFMQRYSSLINEALNS